VEPGRAAKQLDLLMPAGSAAITMQDGARLAFDPAGAYYLRKNGGNIEGSGNWSLNLGSNTASFAGVYLGSGSIGLEVGSSGPTIRTGTGAPAADAPIGSLYLRLDGGAGTSLYVKQVAGAGAGNWGAK
jgi:hypothetical protein